jgi:hypothetical protein
MIIIEPDTIREVPNKTSEYKGVCWNTREKKWQARLMHNKKSYTGGNLDKEEQAAMQVNLLCDKYGIKRKNPMIDLEPDAMQQVSNQTSKYTGVHWNKDAKKWVAKLMHNRKVYCGGYFDHEKEAAMKVNLLCDKYGKERKNPTINIQPHKIKQQFHNQTSIYTGVHWHKDAKKWLVHMMHNKKLYYGGYFDNEEQAAMKVNLLCDKHGKERKNPMIDIKLDAIQQNPNQTSKYTGVCWNNNSKQWQARLMHNRKVHYGGLFDDEEQAAMKINLLCDKNGRERKNPMIDIDPDAIQQIPNQTSRYTGVQWNKDTKKWQAHLKHNQKLYYGGLFDNKHQAAMKVNLLCDKNGIKRKNTMIDLEPYAMQQQFKNQTSKYSGVCWNKDNKKWQAQLHNKKKYYGGLFDNEEQAAMKINLLCDKIGIERKNPMIDLKPDAMQQKIKLKHIVDQNVKLEDENILNGFKDECENHVIKSKDEKEIIATKLYQKSQKRKRPDDSIINEDGRKDENCNY